MKHFFLVLFAILMVGLTVGKSNAQRGSMVEFDIRQELEGQMNLFEEVIQHIRQNNWDELRRMDDDLEEAISFLHSWQQARRNIARGIRVRTAPDEKINKLAGDFLESVMDAESARSELSMGWPLFVEKPQNSKQFTKQIEEFIKAHRLLFNKARKMYQNRMAVSLPNIVGVYGLPDQITLADGKQCGIEFVVENIGTSRLNEIEFNVASTAGKEVPNMRTEPSKITTVSPGKAVKTTLCTSDSSVKHDLVRLKIESKEINRVELLRIIGSE